MTKHNKVFQPMAKTRRLKSDIRRQKASSDLKGARFPTETRADWWVVLHDLMIAHGKDQNADAGS